MTIQAIQTAYKGYRFRSRLEARWAVFFDALGIRWEYEPEGFELPSGRYLPDFWLPDQGTFVEVKPDIKSIQSSPKVYLAGPMGSAGGWRRRFQNINIVGPGEHPSSFANQNDFDHNTLRYRTIHGEYPEAIAIDVVRRSCAQIRQAAELWAWIPDPHRYGTVAEIGYASALFKKTRVAIGKGAMIRHEKAHETGSYCDNGHGQFQSHELWFIETMANVREINVTIEHVAKTWSPKLNEEQTKCAELSLASRSTVLMCHDVPQKIEQCVCFSGGQRLWTGWPSVFDEGRKTASAVIAAKSARFEHGEHPSWA